VPITRADDCDIPVPAFWCWLVVHSPRPRTRCLHCTLLARRDGPPERRTRAGTIWVHAAAVWRDFIYRCLLPPWRGRNCRSRHGNAFPRTTPLQVLTPYLRCSPSHMACWPFFALHLPLIYFLPLVQPLRWRRGTYNTAYLEQVRVDGGGDGTPYPAAAVSRDVDDVGCNNSYTHAGHRLPRRAAARRACWADVRTVIRWTYCSSNTRCRRTHGLSPDDYATPLGYL